MKILECRGLCKDYESGRVLSDIDLEIRQGEFAAVMGQSGCGKSTLLYCLSGMDRPSQGEVFFEGREITALPEKESQALRLNRMGFVFQKPGFLKSLTLLDNILFPAFQAGKRSRTDIEREARALMEEMGILAVADHDIHKVSGGQLQRAAICRAMINHPDILFGDELTGALNSSSTQEVAGILDGLHHKGTTILLVTHDANVALHAQRVIYLQDGRVMDALELGTYEEKEREGRERRMKAWLERWGF